MNSLDRNIFIGSSNDPQPAFRDEAEDAASWPEDAVMTTIFDAEGFPGAGREIRAELPKTEYYGADGWPIGFPGNLKLTQPPAMKRELQVYPWQWRSMTPANWERARQCPEAFEDARIFASITRTLSRVTSKLCDR